MENDKKSTPTPGRVDRMQINFGPPPKRRRQEGDKKMIKGEMHICRQQQNSEGFYLVKRGRPMLEWVTLEQYKKGYND